MFSLLVLSLSHITWLISTVSLEIANLTVPCPLPPLNSSIVLRLYFILESSLRVKLKLQCFLTALQVI